MNHLLKRYKDWGFDQTGFQPPSTKYIRVNTLKINPKELIKRLEEKGATLCKVDYLEYGYAVEAPFSLGATEEYLLGYYYLQEAAAQIPAQVLDAQPNTTIIDACAAPGGKTTQLAADMKNSGALVALDNHSKRLQSLANNIQRCGCSHVAIIHKDAQYLDELDIKADAILVDAPCSGNFVIEAHWFKKRTLQDFKSKQQIQKNILRSALKSLNSGGKLVYSTCSLEKEENEDVVEWALNNLNLKLLPIKIKTGAPGLTDSTKDCLRMWPVQHGTQGFFVALFQKL